MGLFTALTDAPMFLIGSLDIGGHGLQKRLHDLPNSSIGRIARDLGRRGFALPQRFSQAFNREIQPEALLVAPASALAVAKQVHNGFCGIVVTHRHTLNYVHLDALIKHLRTKADELNSGTGYDRPPILLTNGNPDP